MGKTARADSRREKGNVAFIFAGILIILIFFVGLATDISMVLWHHNRLENTCQLVRDNRYTYQDTVRYSDNPAASFAQCAATTLAVNGYNGKATVYFKEDDPQDNFRHFKVRLVLTDKSSFYFLRLFGQDSVEISSQVDFEDSYGEKADDVVWRPSASALSFNGGYRIEGPNVTYLGSVLPSDW